MLYVRKTLLKTLDTVTKMEKKIFFLVIKRKNLNLEAYSNLSRSC